MFLYIVAIQGTFKLKTPSLDWRFLLHGFALLGRGRACSGCLLRHWCCLFSDSFVHILLHWCGSRGRSVALTVGVHVVGPHGTPSRGCGMHSRLSHLMIVVKGSRLLAQTCMQSQNCQGASKSFAASASSMSRPQDNNRKNLENLGQKPRSSHG